LIGVHDLPVVNATLNATAAVLLVWGHALIGRGRKQAHQRLMVSAFTVSIFFLISYLMYHAQVGSVRYRGTGAMRTTYLTILFTHTVLAAMVPILAILTLRRALKGEFARHRRLAKWTYPIWLYVSVTGVVVYLMLYQFTAAESGFTLLHK
jgi:protein SCO1/2/putative membrane protein